MSNNVLKIVPVSPVYVPNDISIQESLLYLHQIFPFAREIQHKTDNTPQFIDPGSNLQRVICPKCDTVIDDEWWQKSTDTSYRNGNQNLNVTVLCCNSTISLNDLKYDWPAGFARFRYEISDPERNFELEELHELENVLKTNLRIIWAHY